MPLDPSTPPPLRPDLLDLPPYVAVEPVDSIAARLGIDPADVLKLDANENPFGVLPAVRQAIAEANYAVYPDPAQARLRSAIAAYVGAPVEQIVVGAGSDELIELTLRALVAPGQHLLTCSPTFGMYRFLADVHRLELDLVERREDFSLDLDAVLPRITDDTALIVLPTPNNPTGNALSEAELEALLATGVTVVLDEAYAEFKGDSFIPWMDDHPRLIVLRTFSKWAGLAGLRVGFGVLPEPVADLLLRIKQPYSVNLTGEVGALAALEHVDDYHAQLDLLRGVRRDLSAALAETSWIHPYPSDGNFLLCEVEGGDGAALYAALAQQGVFVRFFADSPRLSSTIRISMPRPDQLPTLLERLRAAAAACGLE